MAQYGSTYETVKAWASGASEGKNRHGTVYFHNRTIFSYGSHFPMARFVEGRVALYTTRGYSNSTARHKSYVWRALYERNVAIFNVFDPSSSDNAQHFQNYLERAAEVLDQAAKARSRKDRLFSDAAGIIEEANHFATLFELNTRAILPSLTSWKLTRALNVDAKVEVAA